MSGVQFVPIDLNCFKFEGDRLFSAFLFTIPYFCRVIIEREMIPKHCFISWQEEIRTVPVLHESFFIHRVPFPADDVHIYNTKN